MSTIDNIGRGEFEQLKRELRALQTQSPLENSSVTNGRLRFIGGTLRVDSGGRVEIVGTLDIDGTTEVTGSFTVSGPWNMTGNGTITGDVTISGDFNVTGGGKIAAGNVTIEPNKITIGTGSTAATIENGEFKLNNGAKLATYGSSIGMLSPDGSSFATVTDTEAILNSDGRYVRASSAGVRIYGAGAVYIDDIPTGAPAGAKALLIDPATGRLYRAS